MTTGNPNGWVDPSTEFDFERVDDPEACVLEELRALARARKIAVDLQQHHAVLCIEWASHCGIGPGDGVFEKIAAWIGGPKEAEDIAFRASVFIRAFAPLSKHCRSLTELGRIFGVSRQRVRRLVVHARASLINQYRLGPDGELIQPKDSQVKKYL